MLLRSLFLVLAFFIPLAAQAPPGYTPMTPSERWHRYLSEGFLAPGLYMASLGSAIGSQLGNAPPEWGQGVAGYARRSASNFGVFTAQITMYEAGAAVLGLEPRYQHCGCKGFVRRTGHAFKWSFVTYNNEGQLRLNIPTVAAAYGSSMLSMAWYPDRFHPLTDGVREGNQEMGFAVGVNIIKEFSPELKRIFRRFKPRIPQRGSQPGN